MRFADPPKQFRAALDQAWGGLVHPEGIPGVLSGLSGSASATKYVVFFFGFKRKLTIVRFHVVEFPTVFWSIKQNKKSGLQVSRGGRRPTLGTAQGFFGSSLGGCWVPLWAPWELFEAPGANLGIFEGLLGTPWGFFWRSLGGFEAPGGTPGKSLERFGSLWMRVGLFERVHQQIKHACAVLTCLKI